MINYSSEVLELLDKGLCDVRGLLRFEFGTGTYGFIRGRSVFSYAGLDYVPGGVIEVSDLPGGTGMEARKFTIRLAASPEDDLTPAVLQTIENEDYRDRPVRIYDAFFHPETGELVDVRGIRRGYVDTIEHEENDKDGYTLVANCETRALDYSRTNGRVRSDEDQQRRIASIKAQLGIQRDRILEHAATRGRVEVFWGRKSKR